MLPKEIRIFPKIEWIESFMIVGNKNEQGEQMFQEGIYELFRLLGRSKIFKQKSEADYDLAAANLRCSDLKLETDIQLKTRSEYRRSGESASRIRNW